jgi:hypothetical protein
MEGVAERQSLTIPTFWPYLECELVRCIAMPTNKTNPLELNQRPCFNCGESVI